MVDIIEKGGILMRLDIIWGQIVLVLFNQWAS